MDFNDGYGNDVKKWNERANKIIKKLSSKKVVIFCGAGISRSNAMAVTILVKLGMDKEAAINMIRKKVPIAQMDQDLLALF